MEKRISSETVYTGKIIDLKVDTVALDNGGTALREVVNHPGGAAIVATDADLNAYLVWQYRYAFGKEVLEIPAGKIEKGESPFECAKRELEEECGIVAKKYRYLGQIYPSVGFLDEKISLYWGTDLVFTKQNLDPDENIKIEKINMSVINGMLFKNEIFDAKTVISLFRFMTFTDRI